MHGWTDGWLSGWVDGWMGGWVDGWMGGWVDGWMGGWVDGWMDGWKGGGTGILGDTHVSIPIMLTSVFFMLDIFHGVRRRSYVGSAFADRRSAIDSIDGTNMQPCKRDPRPQAKAHCGASCMRQPALCWCGCRSGAVVWEVSHVDSRVALGNLGRA